MRSPRGAVLSRDGEHASATGHAPTTDAEYDDAIRATLVAYGDGRLSAAQTDERLAAIYAAPTRDELVALSDRAGGEPPRPPAAARSRALLMTLLGCAALAGALTAPGGTWSGLLVCAAVVTTGALAVSDAVGRHLSRFDARLVARHGR
jgi:hypothetical protein